MHTINTFLFGDAPHTTESIYGLVRQYWKNHRSVAFKDDEWMPFGLASPLRVSFGTYFFCVSYIDDASVRQSLDYVQKVTARQFPAERLLGEVRTMFAHDENLDFDHITVDMYRFLEELPGSVVYDDHHKNIMSANV